MTVTLQIAPEVEERLMARAQAIGVPVERFIEEVLEREVPAMEVAGERELTGPEKAAAFVLWAKSFPPDLPVLSLEDISRESMYERD